MAAASPNTAAKTTRTLRSPRRSNACSKSWYEIKNRCPGPSVADGVEEDDVEDVDDVGPRAAVEAVPG